MPPNGRLRANGRSFLMIAPVYGTSYGTALGGLSAVRGPDARQIIGAGDRDLAATSRPDPGDIAFARAIYYEVAHEIDGRIRLRIPRLAYDAKFTRRLTEAAAKLPDVRQVRVNATSSSLVVDYRRKPVQTAQNGRAMAPSAGILPDLLQALKAASGADIAREIGQPAEVRTQDQINYVEHLGLPVLALGLSTALATGAAIPAGMAGVAVLAATAAHFMRGLRGLRDEKQLTVEWLDVVAVSLLVSQGSFLMPAFMMTVIQSGEVLRKWTARRTRLAQLDLLLSHAQSVLVERDGQQLLMSPSDLARGDVILVYPGDEIPVDAIVLDGEAAVDERQANAGSGPRTCKPNDLVPAGTLVMEGHLRILAEHAGSTSCAANARARWAAAPKRDTQVSNYARKTGNWAVVPTLLVAGTVGGASGSLGRATGIITMDMGMGMRVSAPIAILAAQTHAARRGILVRSGRALEMLAQSSTIVLDLSPASLWATSDCLDAGLVAALEDADLTVLLCGANAAEAGAAAARLGLAPERVRLAALSQQKVDLVKELQAGGHKVALLTDHVNATAAMAHADVSLALASCSSLVRESADVLLLNDQLRDALLARQIAAGTLQVIKQNQNLIVASNTLAIAYAALNVVSPITCFIVNNGSALLGVLNSLRPLRWRSQAAPARETQLSPV
jgi:cation transport ATPase